jgi:hypothetical protein
MLYTIAWAVLLCAALWFIAMLLRDIRQSKRKQRYPRRVVIPPAPDPQDYPDTRSYRTALGNWNKAYGRTDDDQPYTG